MQGSSKQIHYKQPLIKDARDENLRESYQILYDSSFINKGKVNFQRKGSINLSYSFLPGDVLTKK